MTAVRDIMESAPLIVSPDTSVKDLAVALVERRIDGACVVQDDVLVGVVTSMDLVFQEKQLHIPSFFTFLDVMIPMQSREQLHEEMRKMAGVTVEQIMSRDPTVVAPDDEVSAAATTMVEEHFTILPVVDDGVLVGVVTKRGLVRAAYSL